MLDEIHDGVVAFRFWLRIEAEDTIAVLDTRMQSAPIGPEAEAKKVVLIGAVTYKKSTICLAEELLFRFYPRNRAPVPAKLGQLEEFLCQTPRLGRLLQLDIDWEKFCRVPLDATPDQGQMPSTALL